MRTEIFKHHQRVIIEPGEFYVSDCPVTISTLLGSCVAVCLFDPINKVMGMNHFMLSHNHQPCEQPVLQTDAGRYGVNAMELLINKMLMVGAEKRLFKAKVFGGGNVLKNVYPRQGGRTVGEQNIAFIRDFLHDERIPLVAESLGGNEGRVIHFSYGNFSVYARKIKSAERGRRLGLRDHNCWLHAMSEQEKHSGGARDIELWGND
ncbi:MAG: chemotaxis protein CheD [Deltaproteobacteria bacterium]|nr:chemotaxis protein CheD [Deltaproteobacteria bacterium]